MNVTDRPHQTETPKTDRPKGRNRVLTITVVILAIALLALGAWLIYDLTAESDTAASAEIEQLLDDYLAAWENDDESAIRQAITEDYTLTEHYYLDWQTGDRRGVYLIDDESGVYRVASVITAGFSRDYRTKQVGPAMISGDGPWFVSVRENWIQPDWRSDGIATYVIVEREGAIKIASHYWAGLRTASD